MQEMTLQELRSEFADLRRQAGDQADLYVHFQVRGQGPFFTALVYPEGIGRGRGHINAEGDTLESLLVNLREVLAESAERRHAERVRKMALAIIRITAEQGTCTDAALRADDFTAEEVARYSEEAIADANEIASAGPFSIVKLAGANAA